MSQQASVGVTGLCGSQGSLPPAIFRWNTPPSVERVKSSEVPQLHRAFSIDRKRGLTGQSKLLIFRVLRDLTDRAVDEDRCTHCSTAYVSPVRAT